MSCPHDPLRDVLGPDASFPEAREHWLRCAECAAALERLHILEDRLRGASPAELGEAPDEAAQARILARVVRARAASASASRSMRAGAARLAVAAMALGAIVSAFSVVRRERDDAPSAAAPVAAAAATLPPALSSAPAESAESLAAALEGGPVRLSMFAALQAIAAGDDRARAASALRALGRLGGTASIAAIRSAGADPARTAAAIEALGDLARAGSREALDALIAWTDGDDAAPAVWRAIGRAPQTSALERLLRASAAERPGALDALHESGCYYSSSQWHAALDAQTAADAAAGALDWSRAAGAGAADVAVSWLAQRLDGPARAAAAAALIERSTDRAARCAMQFVRERVARKCGDEASAAFESLLPDGVPLWTRLVGESGSVEAAASVIAALAHARALPAEAVLRNLAAHPRFGFAARLALAYRGGASAREAFLAENPAARRTLEAAFLALDQYQIDVSARPAAPRAEAEKTSSSYIMSL